MTDKEVEKKVSELPELGNVVSTKEEIREMLIRSFTGDRLVDVWKAATGYKDQEDKNKDPKNTNQ